MAIASGPGNRHRYSGHLPRRHRQFVQPVSYTHLDVYKRQLVLSVLTMSLAAPGLYAQTASAAPAGTAQQVANAVDPRSIQSLRDMGAYLQPLTRFQVSTKLTGERVLDDGQKLQHSATANIEAVRPNMLRARMFSARAEREIFYDGKLATISIPAQKAYSTVEFTGNLGELVSKLEAVSYTHLS